MILFLIILALFVQEPASTDAAIFHIRELHLNLWLMHSLWLVATVIDIVVGYKVGKYFQIRHSGRTVIQKIQKWTHALEEFIGKKGEIFAIVLIGIINFPWLNAFLVSWLRVPFKRIFWLLLLGDLIYWIVAWMINIGVRFFVTDSRMALYGVVGI